MKFEFGFSGPGRRNLIIGFVVLVVLASIIFIVIRTRSKYSYPDSSTTITVNNTNTNLQSAIADCTTKYRQAIMTGLSDSSPITKAQCVQNAVNAYFAAKCPFIANGVAPSTTANPPQTQAQVDAYNQYSGSGTVTGGGDAGVITASAQYTGILVVPTNGTTNSMILKARKADLTGPTRKYIANACSGFYTPPDSGSTDLSSIYTGWKNITSTPTGSDYGFYATNVTGPRIYEWALKAATPIVTSGSDIAADVSPATSTNRTVSVTPAFDAALAANTKIRLQGVTYTGDITIGASTTTSSLVLNYSQQTFPAIPAGTAILKNTSVTINSIQLSGDTQAKSLPLITQSASQVTSATLNLAGPLDDSLGVNSQVLLSGTSLTGAITISAYTVGASSVTISFNSQTFPLVPSGATIENALEIPYALPVVSPPAVYVTTAYTAGATAASITFGVNATGGTSAASTPVTLGSTPVVVTLPTITFPTAAASLKASIASTTVGGVTTYTMTLTSYATGGTTTASITWPTIPAGTVIFDTNGLPFITAASTTNTLYKKIGSLSGQKMLNWQIAQMVGPGTNWPSTGGGLVWGA